MTTRSAAEAEPLALRARGTLRSSLDAIEAALVARTGEPSLTVERDGKTLLVTAHPAAAPIVLEESGGAVALVAETATAGPGLHAFVVELARSLSEHVAFDLTAADDPSGFARTGDVDALLDHAARWLSGLARDALALVDAGARGLGICLPADVTFEDPAAVLTPLGPRDRAWLARVAADGRAGADALPWWQPGTGAAYHRDRALTLLWTEVRPRRPIDEDERALVDRVLGLLELAHGLDPEIPLPWRAWSELFEQRGEDSLRATRAHLRAASAPPSSIGYRRAPVRVELPAGWSVRIPGTLKTKFDEHGTFVAWDAKRTFWITTITASVPSTTDATMADLREPDGTGDLLSLEKGELRGRARFGKDEGGWNVLRAQAAVGGHAALGTLIFEDERDKDAVLEVWGSIDHPDSAPAPYTAAS